MDDDLRNLEAELGRLPTARELAQYRANQGGYTANGYDYDSAGYDVREASNHRRLTSSEAFEIRRHNERSRAARGN